MPTTIQPMVLGAKSTQLTDGVPVTFNNLTRGGKVTILASGGEAVTTQDNWVTGDEILIQVIGKYNSSTKVTSTKGGVSKNLGTLSEDASTPGINL